MRQIVLGALFAVTAGWPAQATAHDFGDSDLVPIAGSVSLSELESLSGGTAQPSSHWSLDLSRDAATPAEAYSPGRPIDDAPVRSRLALTLNANPEGAVQPFIGAGIESEDFGRFGSDRPFDGRGGQLSEFAYTVVAGVNVDVGGWKLKLDGSNRKFGLAAKLTLN